MSKTVFAFGRMNPPTIGHEKLAAKVESEARRRGAMPHIYLSHTQNATKDPLPYNVKITIAKKAFGKAVTTSSAKNIIQIMQELENMGHTEVTLVAGSDRVPEFKTLLRKYNGKEYNFKKIEVVSAGERDPDAQGVEGMSASKLRAIAKEGDYDTFAQGMPSKLTDRDKKKVYNSIRSVMEEWNDPDPSDEELDEILSEIDNDDDLSWEWDEDQLEFDLDEERKPLTLGQRMKRRIMMKRLAPKIARMRKIKMRRKAGKEQLQKRARKSAIMILKKRVAGARGSDYKNLSPSEKIGIDKLVQKRLGAVDKIAKRLMPKILKKETERVRAMRSGKVNEEFEMLMEKPKVSQDPDVDERPGTQPKKYFSGVRKKSKEARAKHFERGAKMDDDNPAAYKPAPGDAGAKTKPSKHTKKFKQMYGEEVTAKQISDLEKFGDRLLDKFGIDIEFSKHFADRMNDDRNNPEIKVAEIQALFKKIARKKAVNIKKHKDSEVVLKDIQKDLNLPIAVKTGKDGELDVVHKTIMRKKNFKTPNPVVQYEDINEAFEKIMTGLNEAAEYLEEKQIDALKKKSEKTGIPYGILKQVYNRGMAAWRTGHRPGTTPQQWAFARVNSFATKSKGTWGGADKDLAAKARGSMKKEEVSEADPCWDGYKQVGMKKNAAGKDVPNCVPEEVEVEGKVEFETDKDLPNLRKPKRTTDFEFQKFLMKTKSKQKDSIRFGTSRARDYSTHIGFRGEAVSPAQQAAIAIAKKKSGKYDDEGKKLEEDILQSPRDGIRLIVRKHTDGKRYVLKMMTQNKPGEPKILSKKDAEKQISALKRMGWKKAANEEGGAGEEGTYELVRKYKKDTPMQESDAANAAKDRHDREKERLKAKHDREMDAARLRDTRSKNMDEEFEELCCDDCLDEDYGWEEETDFIAIDEGAAEYQGRKVKLNNPTRSDNPKKKTMVYVKNDKGNVVKVYFGDPNLSIKRDDPERRKSFRARHNCDNPGPKWKARYWSCKFWSSKKVSDLMKG